MNRVSFALFLMTTFAFIALIDCVRSNELHDFSVGSAKSNDPHFDDIVDISLQFLDAKQLATFSQTSKEHRQKVKEHLETLHNRLCIHGIRANPKENTKYDIEKYKEMLTFVSSLVARKIFERIAQKPCSKSGDERNFVALVKASSTLEIEKKIEIFSLIKFPLEQVKLYRSIYPIFIDSICRSLSGNEYNESFDRFKDSVLQLRLMKPAKRFDVGELFQNSKCGERTIMDIIIESDDLKKASLLINSLFNEYKVWTAIETRVKDAPNAGNFKEFFANTHKLFELVKYYVAESIQELLSKPICVNCKDYDQKNVIIRASHDGKENILKLLLLFDYININEKDDEGRTAFMLASQKGRVNIVELLLKIDGISINEKDNQGRTAFMLASMEGKEKIVELLLKIDGISINEKDNYGMTALMLASQRGHVNIVELLLKIDGKAINEKDNEGFTALMLASQKGHVNIVELLLEREDIAINEKNNQGNTALILAGKENIVKLLLKRKNIAINEKNYRGETALIRASKPGKENIVKLLLKIDGIAINEKDNQGRTALMWASFYGHKKIVKSLLKRKNIAVHEKDNEGKTAYMLASMNGRWKIMKLLQKHKPIASNEKDNEGKIELDSKLLSKTKFFLGDIFRAKPIEK